MHSTVVAFELAPQDATLLPQVRLHLLSPPYQYTCGVGNPRTGIGLPFPSNVLGPYSEATTPQQMVADVQAVCAQLGVQLHRCVTFTYEMLDSVGLEMRR
ncbi:hypothetical protein [Hymenobacter crusticola]|uniref:Uncharacterized protein n=1 Tax=Hymenobacter crusticola TaxID=1770526 RepID=A0A243W5X1_9BACT|nr:hypothetical protein [Hymenobacter crusticola]OUJ69193.1 hypothetical protein BXP70_26765 [Hymenobacter crusticola]